jgi:hypothetical protein
MPPALAASSLVHLGCCTSKFKIQNVHSTCCADPTYYTVSSCCTAGRCVARWRPAGALCRCSWRSCVIQRTVICTDNAYAYAALQGGVPGAAGVQAVCCCVHHSAHRWQPPQGSTPRCAHSPVAAAAAADTAWHANAVMIWAAGLDSKVGSHHRAATPRWATLA